MFRGALGVLGATSRENGGFQVTEGTVSYVGVEDVNLGYEVSRYSSPNSTYLYI